MADFDGDGRTDLATANEIGDTVSVLRNTTGLNGLPTFAPQQTLAVGLHPYTVVVADFDADGRPDLAVANMGRGIGTTVSVLRNTTAVGAGSLSFAPQQTFSVGVAPTWLATGDFDADGRSDIAVSSINGGAVSLLWNRTDFGAGTFAFAAPTAFSVGGLPAALAAADFDADGRLDLAFGVGGTRLGILRNTTTGGVGSFAPVQTPVSGVGIGAVTVADFDRDGRPDLAGTNTGGGTLTVLRNTTPAGSSTFGFVTKVQATLASGPVSVLPADFDGDGRTDLAVGHHAATGIVTILTNWTAPGGPFTFDIRSLNLGPNMVSLTLGASDLNGDGRPELIAANDFISGVTPSTLSVLRNTSAGGIVGTPNLVGQLGTTGVWAYDHTTDGWRRLTASNASALATAPNGDVAANFPGFGVYSYRAGTNRWVRISGVDASAVAIDRWGNAYANFRGYGTYIYRLATSSWSRLPGTTAAADKLAVSGNGDVIADFPGFGVYRYRATTGWVQLNGFNATAMAVDDNGFVVASFRGVGIGHYIPYANGWRLLLPGVAATALAVDGAGNIYAGLPGAGVNRWSLTTRSWANLTPYTQVTSLAVDFSGNVYAGLTGFGVWEYRPMFGWFQRRLTDASMLRLG